MKRTKSGRQFPEKIYISIETRDLKTVYPKHFLLSKYHELAMHCLNFKPKKIEKKNLSTGQGRAGKQTWNHTDLTLQISKAKLQVSVTGRHRHLTT